MWIKRVLDCNSHLGCLQMIIWELKTIERFRVRDELSIVRRITCKEQHRAMGTNP